MAKKKSVSKSRQKAGKAKKGKGFAKSARSQALPGMEAQWIVKLDNACERISDTRAELNKLREDEAGDERIALDLMRTHDLRSYRHAGVELVRVPGEEKLRVRTSRTSATAESEDVEMNDTAQGSELSDSQE